MLLEKEAQTRRMIEDSDRMKHDVCIVGLGPSGLGTALALARAGLGKKILCLEAGVPVEERFCSINQGKGCRKVQPCQVMTGIGGASLFGGKVSKFPAGRAMSNIIGDLGETKKALDLAFELFSEFVELTPPPKPSKDLRTVASEFLDRGFDFRHYDSYSCRRRDLVSGYQRMIDEIVHEGTKVVVGAKVTGVDQIESGFRVSALVGKDNCDYLSENVVLAIGRSGENLFKSVESDFALGSEPNRCDVGVRLEFPTSTWPDIDSCHNDLKLQFGAARTFCVCKDGYLAPYRMGNFFLLEGYSDQDYSTGFTNLAIVTRVDQERGSEAPALLTEIQRRLLSQSHGIPIRQKLQDFISSQVSPPHREPASILYCQWGEIMKSFPEDVGEKVRTAVETFAAKLIPVELHSSVSVFAPEMDYYWPRLPLRSGFASRKERLYVVGDCAGHFRGILQAFCSGIVCAKHIVGS